MSKIFYQTRFIAMINPIWIILLALLLTAASCRKEEEPKHRDVFRCEINGVPWEALCESTNLVFGCSAIDCQYYPESGGLELGASNHNESGISLRKNSTSGGLQLASNLLTRSTFGLILTGKSYNMKEDNPGTIYLVTVDSLTKLIQCNFEFIGYSSEGDSVIVSNGYFKVRYRP